MNRRRRFVAWLAILGVAWAALWPLISAGHAQAAGEAMPLCHMAGMMVDPGEMPDQPAAPGEGHGKTHCPLCIMAFYGTSYAPPAPPPFTFSTGFVALDTHCAPLPFGVEIALPESRAPPRTPIAI